MAEPFANFQRYGEGWEVIEELTPGGQGAAFRARSRTDNKEAFLKVLSRQSDVERRARFFREATAYSTHRHAGLPTLIESNAQHHGDLKYKLYLATEFVEGPTLSKFIGEGVGVSLQNSIDIALCLLRTVEFLHRAGWIHRDIKPDNIILRNGDLSDAVLLDFGLGYSEGAASDHSTETSQEIGNRFLRLPELSANSSLKRDARTDVTFAIAIFFFALTGRTPSVLLDANQRLPHQRDEIPRQLLEKVDHRANVLLAIFDRGFQYRLSDRFDAASTAITEIERLRLSPEAAPSKSVSQRLGDIRAIIDNDANRRIRKNKEIYDAVLEHITRVHAEISSTVAPIYSRFQTGYVDYSGGMKNVLGFCHFANQNMRYAPLFEIKIVGDELVVYADGQVLHRTDAETPKLGDAFSDQLRDLYVTGLEGLATSAQSP